jgi:hypothetical protein
MAVATAALAEVEQAAIAEPAQPEAAAASQQPVEAVVIVEAVALEEPVLSEVLEALAEPAVSVPDLGRCLRCPTT